MEPDGPTFRSLDCRLAALLAATQAADGLGDWLDNLVLPLDKAKDRNELAERLCADGKARQPRVRLRQVARLLTQYSHRLQSRPVRTRVTEEIREPLAQTADAIKADARARWGDVRCDDAMHADR
jgi:hypothetical protein